MNAYIFKVYTGRFVNEEHLTQSAAGYSPDKNILIFPAERILWFLM